MTQLLRPQVRTRSLVPAPKVSATAKQRSEDETQRQAQGSFEEQLSERQTAADDAMTASSEERDRGKQLVARPLASRHPGATALTVARDHSIAKERVVKNNLPAKHLDVHSVVTKDLDVTQGRNIDERV